MHRLHRQRHHHPRQLPAESAVAVAAVGAESRQWFGCRVGEESAEFEDVGVESEFRCRVGGSGSFGGVWEVDACVVRGESCCE